MLYIDLFIVIFSLILLLIFCNSSIYMLWIGVAILGFGLSSVIAALYALMENTLEMSSMICGILNMSGTMGSVITPLVLAKYIESYPVILIWASLVSAAVCVLLLVIIQITLFTRSKSVKLKGINVKYNKQYKC